MQHKYRSNKKETHDQNWNRPNFEPWGVLSVEPPHPTSACGRGTARTPRPTAGVLPLPDGGAGGTGSHGLAGGAAGRTDVGSAGARPGHRGGADCSRSVSRQTRLPTATSLPAMAPRPLEAPPSGPRGCPRRCLRQRLPPFSPLRPL